MGLTINTTKLETTFNGPFTSTVHLSDESGVYAVSTLLRDGTHYILDIGESHEVRTRLENHDRASQWQANILNGLFYSTFYCSEQDRMMLEGHLRDFFNPPCGIR
jgi:hypothetical protein